MKYDEIQDPENQESRKSLIQREIFIGMLDILKKAELRKRSRGGRKNKLNIENRLLMTLEYIMEYRTYFYVAQSYGISQSAACDAIKRIEGTLIKHPAYALPSRKALYKNRYKKDKDIS